jgi:hypothetical protein
MALLFIDGFDVGDVALKYSPGNIPTSTTTRFGYGRAVSGGNGQACRKLIPATVNPIVGVAFMPLTSLSANPFLALYGDAGATTHLTLGLNVSGQIVLKCGATVLATGSTLLILNAWRYVEISATINDTTGSVVVRVDNVVDISFTGDTKNGGTNTTIDAVTVLAPTGSSGAFDDLYICDTNGSVNNTFLGDVRVQTLLPTGAGASTQFTPSVGSNWDNVNDTPYVSTTYNSSATVGNGDTYAMGDLLSGTGTIFGVQDNILALKSDAGAASIKAAIKSGATVYYDTAVALGTTLGASVAVRETDPATSAAWTSTNLDAVEFGAEVA